MRTFLLLLLSLMTGCEAVSNVKVCQGGWVEFTCKYLGRNVIDVIKSGKAIIIQSPKKNEWETTNSVSLYHDTNNRKVRVLIKTLKQEDFAEYQCKGQRSVFDKVKLEKEKNCQAQFIQTAYRTAKTTMTCNYPRNRDESDVLFFCKESKITCEDILSTESSQKSNETFTLTKTNRGFNVSISKVSSLHAGVYWCGVKSNEGSYRAGFRKIQLGVKDITHITRSPTIGQNFAYWCEYPNSAPIKKFICKGEDPSICEPLVNTMQRNKNTGRFSMEDDKKRKITITVREVTTDDTGTYWCGAKSSDDKRSNPFFNRLSMTVVQTSTPTSHVSSAQSTTTSTSAENNAQTPRPKPPPTPPPPTQTPTVPPPPTPTSRVSSAQSTTTSTSAENNGGNITATVCVVVLLLVLCVLILFFIYKRFSHSKNARNGAAARNIREDHDYEEVEEHVQKENSGNATANFSTDPYGSLEYAAINFTKHSSKAGGREALILKPSSSACEYSTVKYSQSPTYYNVNAPSSYLEHPLYSTVQKQKTTTK